jgi:hypothetical protein
VQKVFARTQNGFAHAQKSPIPKIVPTPGVNFGQKCRITDIIDERSEVAAVLART